MVSPAMLMITQNCFPSDADHSQLYRFARDLHPHTEASKFVSAKLVTTHICTFCKTPTPPLETTSPSQQNRKTVNLIITLNFLYLSQEIQIPSRDPEFILAKLMITRTWTFCKGPTSPTKTASPSQLKSKTTNLLITHNFTFYHIPSSHGTWISAKLITRTCTSHTFLQETRIPYRRLANLSPQSRLQVYLNRADSHLQLQLFAGDPDPCTARKCVSAKLASHICTFCRSLPFQLFTQNLVFLIFCHQYTSFSCLCLLFFHLHH